MPSINLNNLERAKQIVQANESELGLDNRTVVDEYIYDTVENYIKNPSVDTISVQYVGYDAVVFVVTALQRQTLKFEITPEEYTTFCEQMGVDMSEEYNHSITRMFDGVRTRIFSMMPPVCQHPILTISTTKEPPDRWDQSGVDAYLGQVMEDNFIIVGKSGAGKTYFFNYLLKQYSDPSWHVGFIEEFAELIPPNEHTVEIAVSPPKPGRPSNLKFAVEQSNLMRFDRFYIGEVKSDESWPAIVNMSSGTRGGFTIHGNDWQDGLRRLECLCMQTQQNQQVVDAFIARAVKHVVVIENKSVKEIMRLTGVSAVPGKFQATEVFGGK